jgi:hypothetical protein
VVNSHIHIEVWTDMLNHSNHTLGITTGFSSAPFALENVLRIHEFLIFVRIAEEVLEVDVNILI